MPVKLGQLMTRLLCALAGAACGGPTAPAEPVLIEPVFEPMPATVVAGTLTVSAITRNLRSTAITFELRRPCGATVMVYDDASLVWDGWSWLHASAGGCKGGDYARVLEPGDSIIVGAVVPVAEVLGDSLPDQPYRVSTSIFVGPPTRKVEIFAEGVVSLTKN